MCEMQGIESLQVEKIFSCTNSFETDLHGWQEDVDKADHDDGEVEEVPGVLVDAKHMRNQCLHYFQAKLFLQTFR